MDGGERRLALIKQTREGSRRGDSLSTSATESAGSGEKGKGGVKRERGQHSARSRLRRFLAEFAGSACALAEVGAG